MTKGKFIIHQKYDFHDNRQEIGDIQLILQFLVDNGYEIIHFNRLPSAQNPHYDNVTFTAVGDKELTEKNLREVLHDD